MNDLAVRAGAGMLAMGIWLAISGCEPRPAARATVTLPLPAHAPALITSAHAPPPKQIFRRRLRVETAGLCNVMSVAPVASGGAWVAGDCNLRLYLETGGVRDHAGEWTPSQFPFGLSQVAKCTARWLYPAIVAASATDAFVLAERRCGLDPITLAPEPLERFDGEAFASLPSKPEPWLWRLARSPNGTIYGMVAKEGIAGALPNGAIYRLVEGGWRALELQAHDVPDGASTAIAHFTVSADEVVWIVGSAADGVWSGSDETGWSWHPVSGCGYANDIQAAPDGSIWLACTEGVLRFGGTAWSPIAPPATSVWPRGKHDAWLTAEKVQRYDGSSLKEVPVDGGSPSPIHARIRGSGEHVWIHDQRGIWSLAPESAPVPQIHVAKLSMDPP